MGNRFRGGDGGGPLVADQLRGRLPEFAFIEGRNDTRAIINAWEGAELAAVVGAAYSGASPGTIHRLEVGKQSLPKDIARRSSHGLGLAEAIELAKELGRLPARLLIYGVEASSPEAGSKIFP